MVFCFDLFNKCMFSSLAIGTRAFFYFFVMVTDDVGYVHQAKVWTNEEGLRAIGAVRL